MEERHLSKWVNLAIMLAANCFVAGVVYFILSRFLGTSWFLWLVSGVITFPVLTVAGLVDIPIRHAGVPLVFGKRQSMWLLDEGLGWILPSPIMGFEKVSLQEQTIQIPKDGEEKEKPLIVPAIRGLPPNKTDGTGTKEPKMVLLKKEKDFSKIRFVQMNARIVIRYSIIHPFQFLNQGENIVERGLGDLAIKTLRQKGTVMCDIDLIRQKDLFEEEIIKAMADEPKDVGGKRPLERWGVRVHNVFIPRIMHNDPTMAEAYELAMKEEQQKTAEEIEQIFLAESIDRLVGKGLSPQEALYAIQSERGKLTRREVIITSTGGAAGDIAKAVATYAGLLGDQPQPEKTENQNQQKGGKK